MRELEKKVLTTHVDAEGKYFMVGERAGAAVFSG
jgi:hypothetical protein